MAFGTIGRWGCLALFLLRFAIGWHFYQEGRKKIADPEFSSAGFLRQATGPLAEYYHKLAGDPWEFDLLEPDLVARSWEELLTAAVKHSTSPDMKREMEVRYDAALQDLRLYFQQRKSDIDEYLVKARAAQAAAQDRSRSSPAFRKDWYQTRLAQLQALRAPWISDLKQMTAALRQDLIAATEGRASSRDIPAGPFAHLKTWVDHSVGWTLTLVGVCLLLGLCVRIASGVGLLFLLTVVASQPFWVADANLMVAYYQWVEMAGLVVLAVFSAGQYAGLDFLLTRKRSS